jgi:ankyrin repeat protein
MKQKDEFGWTPLHFSASRGRKDATEILLENGSNINAKNNFDDTPLRTAIKNGETERIQLLSSYGGV